MNDNMAFVCSIIGGTEEQLEGRLESKLMDFVAEKFLLLNTDVDGDIRCSDPTPPTLGGTALLCRGLSLRPSFHEEPATSSSAYAHRRLRRHVTVNPHCKI